MKPLIIGLTGPNAAGKGEVARYLAGRGFAYHSLSDVVREEATRRGLDHSRENLIRTGNDLRVRFGPGVLAARIAERLRQSQAQPLQPPVGSPSPPLPVHSPPQELPVHSQLEKTAAPFRGPYPASSPGDDPGVAPSSSPGLPHPAPSLAAFTSVHPSAAPSLPAIVDSVRSPSEVEVLRGLPGFILLGVDAPLAVRFERSRRRGRIGDGESLAEFARKEALENSTDPAAQQLSETLKMADIVVDNTGTLEELHKKVALALSL